MSDTPRTDAASISREYIEREMDRYTRKFVLADHMGDLERELAEAKNDAERYRYVRSIWGLPDEKFNAAIDAAMKEGK